MAARQSPEHLALEQTRATQFAVSFTRLRDDDRLLLNLRYVKALPVLEITALMGRSEAVVRKRLLRALQRLRRLVGEG